MTVGGRLATFGTTKGLCLLAVLVASGLVVGAHVAASRLLASAGYRGESAWWSPLELVRVSFPTSRLGTAAVAEAWGTGLVAAALFVAVGALAVTGLLRRARALDGYGTARWATRADIVETGLLDAPTTGQSLIVGGWTDPARRPARRRPGRRPGRSPELLVHTGPESLVFFAPSRSGKSVGVVVPNLLCYESSALVLDVKGELWELTAGYRQRELGQKVLFHDPTEPGLGARFNPLAEIDVSVPTAVREVQTLLQYLIPSTGKDDGSNSAHFTSSARALAVGVFLNEMTAAHRAGRTATIADVLSAITSPTMPFRAYLAEMNALTGEAAAGIVPALARTIRETAAEMLQREEREFSGVLSSLVTPLSIFRDPLLEDATSRSDFRIMDLVSSGSPATLYLTIRPSDRDRLKHYFGLIVNLVCRRLTDRLPVPGETRHELLLMLDEFSSLPPLPVVQQSMDVMPGYGVKAFVVLQDIESLEALYGQHETISSNCRIQVAYTPSKPKTAKHLSEMTGVSTVRQETSSLQHKAMGIAPSSISDNEGFHQRALLTPDEVMRLGTVKVDGDYRMIEPGEALIFARGCYPIRGVQTPFFMDPELARRATVEPPPESDRLRDAHGDPTDPGDATGDVRSPAAQAPVARTIEPDGLSREDLDDLRDDGNDRAADDDALDRMLGLPGRAVG